MWEIILQDHILITTVDSECNLILEDASSSYFQKAQLRVSSFSGPRAPSQQSLKEHHLEWMQFCLNSQ